MPTQDGTAMVYTGTCVFEDVGGVSEGRGTTRPFEIIGLPAASTATAAAALTDALNSRGLPGVHFRTTFFTPTFGKLINKPCGGVQLHITNTKAFKPVITGLEIVQTIAKMFPQNVTIFRSIEKKTGVDGMQSKVSVCVLLSRSSWSLSHAHSLHRS
jgi:uncharacterized protein YbbC (DUF1343 family)